MESFGPAAPFPGDVIIEGKENANWTSKKKYQVGIVLWTDGSRLDTGNVGAAVIWRDKSLNKRRETSLFLRENKKILDAELWAISIALEAAKRETGGNFSAPITVFTDSREAACD